ncbi:LPS-assembly protein LptD [Malaciobacter mytili]|uniref:LPS-assembly protein LptD n=1 Tax=Malaciobacter mytili TaxID=603050 RepID=UPI003A850730
MFKKLVFICLVALCSKVSAKDLNSEKFQIVANNVDSENDSIIATGDVVIFSSSYYASAKKVVYNQKNDTFEFFDDVLIIKDNKIQTQSDYAFLDNTNNALYQKPSLIFENAGNIWINSKESKKDKEIITLEDSVLSSCDCEDPTWSIKASSAKYNSETKWLHAFNTRLYIKDIPVLYTPYFGFSTDRSRRTGLLLPTVGYGKNEGFVYVQPIFIAPAENYDFEIIPQIRTNRGKGIYGYFRMADSKYSNLSIGTGYFKEKSDYFEEEELRNQEHYGWEIKYERTKLFSNDESQDGLYVDAKYFNDIEYRNIEDRDYNEDEEKKVESKINYFYNTSNYYSGLYFRHYKDMSLESNRTTMQELPQLHFHKYSQPAFLDNLLYSIDTRYTNHTRDEGITAQKYDLNIPISYSIPLFDDYLQFIIKNETVLNHYKYSNTDLKLKDGTFVENITTLGLSTDLLKPYDSFIHTMNLSASYVDATTLEKTGNLYSINTSTNELSVFPINETKRAIELALNQSFYDIEDLRQIINHKLKQSIAFDNFNNPKLQNLENEIIYNYFLGTISNKVIYNHEDNTFIENSTAFTLSYEDFILTLSYYMSKDTPNSGKEDLESYNINANYTISNDYKLGYYENYNIKDKLRSKQGILFSILDRCWELDFRLEKEIKASSSELYTRKKQDVFYVQLLLKPIGGIQQNYKVKDNRE